MRLSRPSLAATVALTLSVTAVTPCTAADWKLSAAALAAGQGLDLATSVAKTPGCRESNPRLQSAGRVVIAKGGIIVGVALLSRFAEGRDSRAARWISRSAVVLGAAVGAKDGLHNLRECGL